MRADWVAAARPRTLAAAVVPVLVGSALAQAERVYDWRAFTLALLGAVALQVAANFANDVSDAHRGADSPDRIGPKRMVASGVITPRRMWAATWVAILLAAVCGVGLAFLAGPLVLLIGLASIVAMLGYVGGPVPYGYRGLGEVFVFLFFGLAATAGSRFVHDGSVTAATWVLAVPVGLLAAAILVVNNLRDLDTDVQAGKRTLAVIIGPGATRRLFWCLLAGSYAMVAVGATTGITPAWSLLAWLTAPLGFMLAATVRHEDRSQLGPALGKTAGLHLLFGVLLALGVALESGFS